MEWIQSFLVSLVFFIVSHIFLHHWISSTAVYLHSNSQCTHTLIRSYCVIELPCSCIFIMKSNPQKMYRKWNDNRRRQIWESLKFSFLYDCNMDFISTREKKKTVINAIIFHFKFKQCIFMKRKPKYVQ